MRRGHGAREIRYFVLFPPDARPRRRVSRLIIRFVFDYICHVARVPTAEEAKKYKPKTRSDPPIIRILDSEPSAEPPYVPVLPRDA